MEVSQNEESQLVCSNSSITDSFCRLALIVIDAPLSGSFPTS